jgi:hypothetical protein
LQSEAWDAADAHADALARRTAMEPLTYSNLIVERGRIFARMGRGTARNDDVGKLPALRAKAKASALTAAGRKWPSLGTRIVNQ